MSNYIDRKQILTFFLEIIQYIADKELQKRTWVRGEGLECYGYDDIIEDFFHEGEEIIENYKDYKITDYQLQLLKELWKKLDPFTEKHYLPAEFIDSPEWENIIEQVKKVLKAFDTFTYIF